VGHRGKTRFDIFNTASTIELVHQIVSLTPGKQATYVFSGFVDQIFLYHLSRIEIAWI
jgi:hypothetical protein